MDYSAFTEILAREGFSEVVLVERQADGHLDSHAHPFEAKALVLEGDLRIREENAETRTYLTGEVFHLPANRAHEEWYGASGVRYLVGRK
ncbi:cupin [Robbsia sp. Bb-Pol-6]|uniref:Cupin n=1 Tax=Robbsia betulipollinis TaxID=2981849 RepID=A0ABT3ZLB7_9BURK|nr:cupin [Robbsia betulipollinis]MCY0387252.1 cupin [Robbsia betulipollinis]